MKINVYTGNDGQNSSVAKIFDSIIKLYKGGFIADGLIKSVTDDTIVTPSVEFVKFNRITAGSDKTLSMDKKGASWFDGLRSKTTALNDFAVWQRFIEMIADEFHRKYSFLEYPTINLTDDEQGAEKDYTYITNVLSTLAKHLKNYKINRQRGAIMTENIFGATMRLEVGDGTGEAVPILGKLYFHTVGQNGLSPMNNRESSILGALLDEYMSSAKDFVLPDYKKGGESVSALMKAIEELFDGDESFNEYLSIDNSRDIAAITELVERGANDEVDVVARRAKVLSFFHVICIPRCYTITLGGDELFTVAVGLGGKLSFYCSHCSEKQGKPIKIIDNDNLIIVHGSGEKMYTPIDTHSLDLGMSELSDNLVKEIIEKNPFKEHARKIECNHIRMEKPCRKYVCQEECFAIDVSKYPPYVPEDSRYSLLCKQCPYSEIVYNIRNKQFATTQLGYCCDTNSLEEKVKTKQCSVCQRTYSDKYFEDGQTICKFCNTVMNSAPEKAKLIGRNLYKRYSSVLPITARLKAVGKPKACAEDDELILFALGDEIRMIVKQNIRKVGVMPSPKVVYKKGGKQ